MRKLIWIFALTAILLAPTFANIEWTVQWDIMLTSLEDEITQNDLTTTSLDQESKTIEFYRNWKTPTTYKSLEDLLKWEKNVTTVTDGCNSWFIMWTWAAMTMMYCEDIYWVKWETKWQRTDAKVSIYWDNANYFSKKLFNKLDWNKKLNAEIKVFLSLIKKESLERASEKVMDLIENVKLTRIAKQFQDEKITKLYFVKISIDDALSIR